MLLTLAVAVGLRVHARPRAAASRLLGLVLAAAPRSSRCPRAEPVRAARPPRGARPGRGPVGPGRHGQARPGRHATAGSTTSARSAGGSAGCRSLAASRARVARDPARLAARAAAARLPRLPLPLHGRQGRFFGRWLLPAYPVLCVLAGYARGRARQALEGAPAARAGSPRSSPRAVRAGAGEQRARRHGARAGGHAALALDWLRENVPAGRADHGRAVRARRWARRVRRSTRSSARSRPTRSDCACSDIDTYREQRLLLRRRREHAEGARAQGRAALVAPLLPGARRRERGDVDVLALRRGRATRSSSPTTSRSTTRRAPSSGPGRWSRSTACATATPAGRGSAHAVTAAACP